MSYRTLAELFAAGLALGYINRMRKIYELEMHIINTQAELDKQMAVIVADDIAERIADGHTYETFADLLTDFNFHMMARMTSMEE